MKYIALTGQIATGKTAVAQALVARGYLLISYTDLLKDRVAQALTNSGVQTSLADILADKEKYRGLIQEFGTAIGFDDGGKYVNEALAEWIALGKPKAVFDNVRTEAQAASVEDHGFVIVQLKAHRGTRTGRIRAAGKDAAKVFLREGHAIEAGLPEDCVDLEITTDVASPEMIADFLTDFTYYDWEGGALEDAVEDYYAFEGHPDDARTFEELANEQ